MCGRYAITLPPAHLKAYFDYEQVPNFPARYNIAPTQPVPVVTADRGRRHFTLMRWGFIPGWVKELKGFPLIINIRSETVEDKASFRAAFQRRRCLLPVDGFYEWHRADERTRKSTPYLLRRPDRGCFAFAGLYETYSDASGGEIDTTALLNTHANGLMAAIHPRSPVIVACEDFECWLDPAASPHDLRRLLKPPPDDLLEMIEIGPAVNKVVNDAPEVQEPARAAAQSLQPRAGKAETQRTFDF